MTSLSQQNHLPYRPNVGIVLLNPQGLIFAGQRLKSVAGGGQAWQMPQGGIDQGEDPEAAAFREMEEEIGTRNARVLATTKSWLTYELPEHLLGHVWGGKYRGQKQKWFALQFLGQDSEISIDTDDPEFRTWAWMSAEDLLDSIVEFKRAVYAEVFAEFADFLK
jgi:putative (di)nucleoside polyphosphate hydrolase